MGKKALLTALAVFVTISQVQADPLGFQNETRKDFLLEGLKQFPFRYGTPKGYIHATVEGLATHGKVKKGQFAATSYILFLVTLEGQILNVEVSGLEPFLTMSINETNPFVGKYQFWHAVILLQLKPDDWRYDWHELQLSGRFFTEWDRTDLNKVTGYKNEVYP
jgi:hypothetical protein